MNNPADWIGRLVETLAVMADPNWKQHIDDANEDIRTGNVRPIEDVIVELRMKATLGNRRDS